MPDLSYLIKESIGFMRILVVKIMAFLQDLFLNKNLGMGSFMLHRASGLLILIFLYISHYFVVNSALRGKEDFDIASRGMQTVFWYCIDVIVTLGVSYHLLNGLRIILVDTLGLTRSHKRILVGAIVLLLMVIGVTTWRFIPKFMAAVM